jgi:hypothetical protein
MLPVYTNMETHYISPNINLGFTPALTDRDKKLFRLYHDICDYFGLSTGQGEQVTPSLSHASGNLEYLIAISG